MTVLVKGGMIHDAIQKEPYKADILICDGKIAKIGIEAEVTEGNEAYQVIEAAGLDIYPGFVDAHCHLGLDGYAIGFEGKDYNEMGDPVTPHLSAIDGINPQDETFRIAREGGVTCVSTGPGSSNVVGGTFCVIKTAGSRVDDMIVKKKSAMKIAFGENPKRCYKDKGVHSRMSVAAKLRELIEETIIYYEKLKAAGYPDALDYIKRPVYNAKLEAMIPVITKQIPLKAHAHRADDIFTAIRIAKEYGLDLRIDHTTDGALIADDLAKEGYPVAVGPSLGHATKYELKNKGFHTPGVLQKAGCQVSIITDSPVIEQRELALCAAKAIEHGLDEFEALKAITINPAKHIGAEDRVGSIEVGKDADLVLCDGNPLLFSAFRAIKMTIINGAIVYQA